MLFFFTKEENIWKPINCCIALWRLVQAYCKPKSVWIMKWWGIKTILDHITISCYIYFFVVRVFSSPVDDDVDDPMVMVCTLSGMMTGEAKLKSLKVSRIRQALWCTKLLYIKKKPMSFSFQVLYVTKSEVSVHCAVHGPFGRTVKEQE